MTERSWSRKPLRSSRNNIGGLLQVQGKLEEAEQVLRRAIAVWEASLGPDHPNVAGARNNLANVLVSQDDTEDAEVEFRRARAASRHRLHPRAGAVAQRR